MAITFARKTTPAFTRPTVWDGRTNIKDTVAEREQVEPPPQKPQPPVQPAQPDPVAQTPTFSQPSQPALPPPPPVRPRPEGWDEMMNGGGAVSTATPGSNAPAISVNPVPPLVPPHSVDPQPIKIQPENPTQAQPAAQPAPRAADAYKPSPRAPSVTVVSPTRSRADELYSYGQQAMANPSRYDSELMKANAKVIEDAINRMRETGMRNLGEHYASRGLTGSSLEGFGVSDLEGELGRYANERATGLMTDAAQTWANDRNSAFGMGLNAAGLGFQQEGRAADDAYRNWQGEQNVYSTGRSQDQNELSLLASLADRFGPDVLRELGYA